MPEANQRIGEYVLIDQIGVGAFGEVWRANHNAWADKFVAIKLPTDPEYVRTLQKEGEAIRRAAHPNIVQAIAFDPFAAEPYLVMEYVPGINLRKLVARGPLKVEVAVMILRQVLAALHHAHTGGVIHRDIKPENILIHQNALAKSPNWKAAVKLTDFGLGAAVAPSPQSMIFSREIRDGQTIVGSHQYMAPEQLEGEIVDARADLYACGIVLFEMLTGKRPAGTEVPGDLNPKVSPELNEIYRRAVARRQRRFTSAQEFLAALVLAAEIPWPKEPAPDPEQFRKKKELYLAVTLAVLAVVLPIMWYFWPSQKPNVPLMPLMAGHNPAVVNHPATQPAIAKNPQANPAPAVAKADSPPAVAPVPSPPPMPAVSVPPPPAVASGPVDKADAFTVANLTDAKEAADIAHSVAQHYPDVTKDLKKLELVGYHDATDMRRHAGNSMDLDKSYARVAVGGTNNFIMLWGIYERWPAGKYLVVYRVQALSDLTGDNICFLDVCRTGNTIASRRPTAAEMDRGKWSEIPVVMNLDEETEVEYRLWPNEHEMALDRVYIFRVRE